METTEHEVRKARLEILRRQDRKKRLPELLGSLSEIAGQELTEDNVLTLTEIDQLRANSTSEFDLNYLNLNFPVERKEELRRVVSALTPELNRANYLTLQHWIEIAVIKNQHGICN
jgi:hypothetical protein